jgi:hypothetical protein
MKTGPERRFSAGKATVHQHKMLLCLTSGSL